MDYIVMFSGGLTSFEAARRAIEKHGHDRVRLWFAETSMEDEDLYRFSRDVERLLEHEIEVLDNDGMTPWDMFYKHRFLGNTRIDPCSKFLKRVPLKRKLQAEYPDPTTATVILGMDGVEDCKRTERAAEGQKPYATWFPLLDEPIVTKTEIGRWLKEHGVERPRLYDEGFIHNNCGGFCVKAGAGQFAHLLKTHPERFADHERREQEFRDWIGKDVSILRDQRGGKVKPMTLLDLRRRIEDGETWAYEQGWSCLCFVDSEEVSWL